MPVVEVERGETEEAHPELFDVRAMLPQPKDKKPGQISDNLIRKFFEEVSCHVTQLQRMHKQKIALLLIILVYKVFFISLFKR